MNGSEPEAKVSWPIIIAVIGTLSGGFGSYLSMSGRVSTLEAVAQRNRADLDRMMAEARAHDAKLTAILESQAALKVGQEEILRRLERVEE